MSDRTLELVVFDVAGTTVAASDDVAEAIRLAFMTFEREVSSQAVAAVRGKSKRRAVRELWEKSRGAAAPTVSSDEIYRELTRRLIEASRDWRPIPGARETIEWLRARRVEVALTTGLDRAVLDAVLERLGWSTGLSSAVLGADEVRRGRPAPDLILRAMELCGVRDARRVAAVGDTRTDLLAAENAGAGWAIGVLTGAHARDDLAGCPHSAILGSVAELPAWLAENGLP